MNLWKDRMAPRRKGRLPRCRRGRRIDARSLWRGRRWSPGWTCDWQAPCGSEWGLCCCPRRCPLTLGSQTGTWLASQGHFKHTNIMVKTLCSFLGTTPSNVPSNNLSFYLYKKVKINTICIGFLRNYCEMFYLHCWIFAGGAEWSRESGWTLSTKVSVPAGVKTTSLLAQGGTKTKLKKCLWGREDGGEEYCQQIQQFLLKLSTYNT